MIGPVCTAPGRPIPHAFQVGSTILGASFWVPSTSFSGSLSLPHPESPSLFWDSLLTLSECLALFFLISPSCSQSLLHLLLTPNSFNPVTCSVTLDQSLYPPRGLGNNDIYFLGLF